MVMKVPEPDREASEHNLMMGNDTPILKELLTPPKTGEDLVVVWSPVHIMVEQDP